MHRLLLLLVPVLLMLGCAPGDLVAEVATDETDETARVYQEGTHVYLEQTSGRHTARVGVDLQWGGVVTELSLDGVNGLNADDPGRALQLSLYDDAAEGVEGYDGCAGCSGRWGWNPVQGGDRYGRGSPVEAWDGSDDQIYVRTRPLEWFPDGKGGGAEHGVPSDVLYEQWVELVPGHFGVFRIRYRVTHLGDDEHSGREHEVPATYPAIPFDRLAHYRGERPWTDDAVSYAEMGPLSEPWRTLYTPEPWTAHVTPQGDAIAVFVPDAYPYVTGWHVEGVTHYFYRLSTFTLGPRGSDTDSFEGEVFVARGSVEAVRAAFADLHTRREPGDPFSPFGRLEHPATGDVVRGPFEVAGWAFDNVGVDRVEVWAGSTLLGTTQTGTPRLDIAETYPQDPDAGFRLEIEPGALAEGSHRLTVRVYDQTGNQTVFRRELVVER